MRTITVTLVDGATSVMALADTATAVETRDMIQAALNQASVYPAGGTVSLSAGDYIVAPGIDAGEGALRVGSNTTFEGAGIGLTTIHLADAPGHDVTGIVRTDSGKTNADGSVQATHDVTIQNLSIDGNKANAGSAQVDGFFCGPKPFTATAVDDNIHLVSVEVYGATRYGIDPHEQTTNLSFTSCISHDNGQDGFTVDYCSNVTMTNCEAYGNGRHGFNIVTSSHDVLMTGNSAHDNGQCGIAVQTGTEETRILSSNIVIQGGSVANNGGDGIAVRQADHVTIGAAGTADGVTIAGNGGFGVLVEGGDVVSITGNTISDNAGGAGSDDSEIRVRGYVQTYLDADALNDVFVYSASVEISGNTIGSAALPHAYAVSYSDAGLPLMASNTLVGIANVSVQDVSKLGDMPVFAAQITRGDDIIYGTSGADSIAGDSGNDKISGGGGNDLLYGGDGNDTLDGGAGNNTLIGGFGDDTFIVGAGDTVIEIAKAGSDTIVTALTIFSLAGLANIENLTGTASAGFTGTGNGSDNIITGGVGNDRLDGGAGNDKLDGGAGDDTYVVDSAGDTISDGAGVDTVLSWMTTTLSVGLENLTLAGTSAINGTGNAAGNILTGNGAANVLAGGDGNDSLDGGLGLDTLDGGLGNDTYVLGAESDTIADAGGDDTIISTISRSLAGYASIERLTLAGAAAINGIGNALANVITGNDGNNILDGGTDAIVDTLSGGLGNDTYRLGAGNDTVVDTGGNDTIISTISRSLAGYSAIENLTLSGAAAINATGNALANVITGNTANNILDGGADTVVDNLSGGLGNDNYVLGAGRDTVVDTGGIDTITSTITRSLTGYAAIENLTLAGAAVANATGNAAANTIIGNSAANIITGGAGLDTMSGGAGRDVFDFNVITETGKTATTRDIITDFMHLTDRIDLATIDANSKLSGNQAFSFLALKGAYFTGAAGQLHYLAQGSNTIIEGDVNGDKIADFQIQLNGLKTLSMGDFVL